MNITNEFETVIYFAQNCHLWNCEIVSVSGNSFPDMILLQDGKEYRAEIEYRASSFISHKHDARLCDIIICWINDLDEFVLPIIELSSSKWYTTEIALRDDRDKEIYFLTHKLDDKNKEIKQLLEKIENMRNEKIEVVKYSPISINGKKIGMDEKIALMLQFGVSRNAIIIALGGELTGTKQDRLRYIDKVESEIS